ncbi:MAG: hypothetical protein ACR2JZ_04845 [Candidatus Limnocylindrales bacterium]
MDTADELDRTDDAARDTLDDGSGRLSGVVAGAQDAAAKVKGTATDVADRVPAAVATAQVAVDDTARTLNELPNQTLMLGTAFSLGLGVGMFLTGTNRLTVLLAMVPAAAMAATLINRDSGSPSLG